VTLGALALGVLGSSALVRRLLAPSGDIDRYRPYYHDERSAPARGAVKVTFLGATTLLLDDGETQLMTDGFFTRPSLCRVLTSKLATDTAAIHEALRRLKIDRLKALFVAHSHFDHALDSAYVAQQTGATLYGSPSTLNIGWGAHLRPAQMADYEPGREFSFGRFRVTVLNGRHSPMTPCLGDLGRHITEHLRQPARARAYKEGGSYDMLIKHGPHTLLIKPSANFVPRALDHERADVVFLSTGALGKQDRGFKDAYYAETVEKTGAKLVIPIHWDNFFLPLSGHLTAAIKVADNVPDAFDYLIRRTDADGIRFRILQGYQSVVL